MAISVPAIAIAIALSMVVRVAGQFECAPKHWFLFGSDCVGQPFRLPSTSDVASTAAALGSARVQCPSHLLIANPAMIASLLPLLQQSVSDRTQLVWTNAVLVQPGGWAWAWPNGTFSWIGYNNTSARGLALQVSSGALVPLVDATPPDVLRSMWVVCHNRAAVPCPLHYTYSRKESSGTFRCVRAYGAVQFSSRQESEAFCRALSNVHPTPISDVYWDPRPGRYGLSAGRALTPGNVLGNGLLGAPYVGFVYWLVTGRVLVSDWNQSIPIVQAGPSHPVCEYFPTFRALRDGNDTVRFADGAVLCGDTWDVSAPSFLALGAVLCRECGFRYRYLPPVAIVRSPQSVVGKTVAASCSGFEQYLYMCANVTVARVSPCRSFVRLQCSLNA